MPVAFTSRPWAERARKLNPAGTVHYYEVEHAQHFDAFLGLPPFAARYVPMIPYVWHLLDLAAAGAPFPSDGIIATKPRGMRADGTVAPLTAENLGTWFSH